MHAGRLTHVMGPHQTSYIFARMIEFRRLNVSVWRTADSICMLVRVASYLRLLVAELCSREVRVCPESSLPGCARRSYYQCGKISTFDFKFKLK